jgi:cytoskeletal protein RodZ
MMSAYSAHRSSFALRFATVIILALLVAGVAMAQITGSSQSSAQDNSSSSDKKADKSDKSSEPATVKLQIHVSTKDDKPISEASVYVRFNESGGFLHHDKLAELDLKTNQDGTAKAPAIPQGKIMIQVIAPGWHTYGQWYDINQSEQVIEIKLERPPRWY